MVWCWIYISPLCKGWNKTTRFFFGILIELLNLHVWSGGETHRRRAWLHRFLFHHGSSSVNHTLLQQFSTKLLFNTSLQHSSPTLLFDALSDLLLPQPSSPTLVYNIASRSKLVLIPDAKIHKLFYMNKFSNRRLFKCKSTPCCQSDFCFLLFFLDGRRGAKLVKPQEAKSWSGYFLIHLDMS